MECYENIQMVIQPRNLTVTLFPHQLASIYQMETFEREKKIVNDNFIKESNIGVNADPTGFGKTLSMIGLILRDKMEWNLETPYVFEIFSSEAGGRIRKRVIQRYDKFPATLVLVSQSIIGQWEQEFLRLLVNPQVLMG